MPSTPSSEAERVAGILNRRGHGPVTATMVQGWIGHGWLGPLARSYPGGGGSGTALGPDAVDIAAVVSCLPPRDRTDTDIVLARFAAGLPVREAEVRLALSGTWDQMLADSGMAGVVGEDEDTIADAAERHAERELSRRRRAPAIKAWEANLRAQAKQSDDAALPIAELAKQALAPMLAAIAGDAGAVDAGIEPLAAAVGLRSVMDTVAEPGWSPQDMLNGAAKIITGVFEDWSTVLNDATLEELIEGRHALLDLYAAAGNTHVVDVLEGRQRRTWSGEQVTVGLESVMMVAMMRRGHPSPGGLLRGVGIEAAQG